MTNYINESYKNALEEINTEIERQQQKLDKTNQYSKEYRQSLQVSINLEVEKLALIQQELDRLMEQ